MALLDASRLNNEELKELVQVLLEKNDLTFLDHDRDRGFLVEQSTLDFLRNVQVPPGSPSTPFTEMLRILSAFDSAASTGEQRLKRVVEQSGEVPPVKKERRESHGRDKSVDTSDNSLSSLSSNAHRELEDYDNESHRSLSYTPDPALEDSDIGSHRSFSWTPDPELVENRSERHRSVSRSPSYGLGTASRRHSVSHSPSKDLETAPRRPKFVYASPYDQGEAERRSLSRTRSDSRGISRRRSLSRTHPNERRDDRGRTFERALPHDRLWRRDVHNKASHRSLSPDNAHGRPYSDDNREESNYLSRHFHSQAPLESRETFHAEHVGPTSRKQTQDRETPHKSFGFARSTRQVEKQLLEAPPHLERAKQHTLKRKTGFRSLSRSHSTGFGEDDVPVKLKPKKIKVEDNFPSSRQDSPDRGQRRDRL